MQTLHITTDVNYSCLILPKKKRKRKWKLKQKIRSFHRDGYLPYFHAWIFLIIQVNAFLVTLCFISIVVFHDGKTKKVVEIILFWKTILKDIGLAFND